MARAADRRAGPVKTYGLTHLNVHVRDPEESARFYAQLLGARVAYRDEDTVEVQTPGARDAITFTRSRAKAGRRGGVEHFGFRLHRPEDIDAAVRVVEAAGGTVLRRGEFVPGEPYVFFLDPDGYEVELWYE